MASTAHSLSNAGICPMPRADMPSHPRQDDPAPPQSGLDDELTPAQARRCEEHVRAAITAERRTMAAELHDSIAQTLSFVKMRMPLLHEAIVTHDEANAVRYCADVRQAATSAHTRLRELLSGFRLAMDPQGLKHALRSSILAFSERTQVALEFDDQAPQLRLSPSQEFQVFQIVQEALVNIAKHAAARHAWLCIAAVGKAVDVIVEDDGCGAPADAGQLPSEHFGLAIMQERAARLGGRLSTGPRAGGGTRVRLTFPLADPATETRA